MKTRSITFLTPDHFDIMKSFIKSLEEGGFKQQFGRCPNGTKDKVVINLRRWCGEWSGFQTFKNQFVYAR